MATWDDLAGAANTALFAVFGETVSYSRPGSSTLDPVAEFDTTAIERTDVQFTGANAPTRALEVTAAEIAGNPQRGDLIIFKGITYQVHQMEPPAPPYPNGTVLLAIRKLGQ